MAVRSHLATILIAFFPCLLCMRGQSSATAKRMLNPSVSLGISEIETGLDGATDLSFTASASLGFARRFGMMPSFEIRGTLPVSIGNVVSEESAVAGLQLMKPLGRFHPFADILAGRGQFNYLNGGMTAPGTQAMYTKSASNLISPGNGIWVDVSSNLSLRADAQLESLKTPVTASGSLLSVPITVAIAYRFTGTKHGHPYP